MTYYDQMNDVRNTNVVISKETLEGLRDAYVALEIEATHPGFLLDKLCSWVEGVLEDAGMIEETRSAIQQAWKKRRQL